MPLILGVLGAVAHSEKKAPMKEGSDYRTLFRPPASGEYVSGEVYAPGGKTSPSIDKVAELVRNPDYRTLFGLTTMGGTDQE